jgi:tetratricopeptide (TPR) repeat protein
MMEQPEVSAPPTTPIGSLRVALSVEARASLESVRFAQEAARLRSRQQTRQARLLFATGAAMALLAVGLAPRVAHWRQARRPASAATAPSPSPISLEAAPRAIAFGAESTVAPTPLGAAPHAAPADLAPMHAAAPEKTESPAGSNQRCDLGSVRTAAWRVSPEACALAFEADPTNATLALAVAQADHARGRLADAAQWAKRALALDPKAAEAYVLIARADLETGRREDAGAAYRHYLELAPRGWHHTEARRALRPARPKAQPDPSGDR